MPLAHAPGAIIFAVRISPHVSDAEPRPNHPLHMPKLACAKYLGMYHPVYIPYLHLLLIFLVSKLFVLSFLISLSYLQGYHLKETYNMRLICLTQMQQSDNIVSTA